MKNKNLERIKIVIFSICALVFLIFIFYIATGAITRYTGKIVDNSIESENFAKCLSENNVKMYGSCECSHCENQKRMFGDNFKYIDYVECKEGCSGANVNLCNNKNIPGYPTWEINEELYPGEQNLEKLSELSGCKLK